MLIKVKLASRGLCGFNTNESESLDVRTSIKLDLFISANWLLLAIKS